MLIKLSHLNMIQYEWAETVQLMGIRMITYLSNVQLRSNIWRKSSFWLITLVLINE
jgi:hypothetical protein